MKDVIKKILKRLLFEIRRRRTKFALRLELFNHSPVLLPWFKMKGEEGALNRIHRLALELESSNTRWATVKFAVVWPIFSCIRAVYFVHCYGIGVKKKYRVRLWLQWKQIVYLANVYNLAPESYYKFSLWNDLNRRKSHLYMQNHETNQLMPWLNRKVDTKLIDNKCHFFDFCHANNLPTASIIATFDKSGKEQWYSDSKSIPNCDLFVKPTNLLGGIGAERLEYVKTCNTWKHDGMELNHNELVNYCRQRASKWPVIVQSRLQNHPSIERFSNGALCTLRVVAYRLPQQKPALLLSSWRMPVGNAVVDNFKAGGISAGVSDTGKLGTAVGKDVRVGIATHHPDTQVRIEGEQLPYYKQMVNLALLAHERFCEPCFVGWDVALTTNGPILLEGNTIWCVDLAQMSHDQPLGETKYGEVFIAAADAATPEPLMEKFLN